MVVRTHQMVRCCLAAVVEQRLMKAFVHSPVGVWLIVLNNRVAQHQVVIEVQDQ
jgi:hypothetical protein